MTEKQQDDKVELLSKDAILAAQDLVYEIVDVPEWGGKVRIKGMTGSERDAFESSMLQGTGKNQKITTADIRAKLCARTIVDNDGKRLFNDGEIAKLGAKSAAALDRVFDKASKLSKISSEDVEELAKNSGIGHSEDS